MQTNTRRTVLAATGAFLAAALVTSGIWYAVGRDDGLSPGSPPVVTAPTTPAPVTPSPSTAPSTMVVKVFIHRGAATDPTVVVARDRTVARSPKVATAALSQLLAGPTLAEKQAGYWSFFSPATAGLLNAVRVADGVAYADFHDFSGIIPNASSSTGSIALLAELDATLRQFGNVDRTVYSFDGDVAAFYEWLQLSSPDLNPSTPAMAIAVARDFVVRVVGLTDPVRTRVRSTGPDTARVTFRPADFDGVPLSGSTTTVAVRRDDGAWQVTGATTETIVVTAPIARQRISSPVIVRGTAVAFEGHVQVRVLRVTATAVANLGTGFVIGGGDEPRAFTGTIRFTAGSARSGWIVFTERSARDGSVLRASAVPVWFAT